MHSKPRVAIVVPLLTGGGGVSAVASFLYRVLDASGRYQPEFISLAMSARDKASVRLLSPTSWIRKPEVIAGSWQGKDFRHVGCYFAELEFQRYLPRRVLTELLDRYDLIQVVAGAPTAGLAVTAARKPTCLFVATTCKQERKSLLARARGLKKVWILSMTYLNSAIDRRVLEQVAHVFAESKYTRQLLSGIVRNDRLSVGVPGVDIDLFHPGNDHLDGHILSVGRFADPRKNVRMLFQAYHRLRQSMPKAPSLILAGESGPSVEDWDLAVSLGISDHVEFRQNVLVEELARLYQGASLFVLSSDEEGLGIVILEAMASRLPVVSTRCGGPETVVVEGETGYLTPVGEARALAEAMQHLLNDPGMRQRMGRAGRQCVEERFSIEAAGKVYLEKHDELLERKAPYTCES